MLCYVCSPNHVSLRSFTGSSLRLAKRSELCLAVCWFKQKYVQKQQIRAKGARTFFILYTETVFLAIGGLCELYWTFLLLLSVSLICQCILRQRWTGSVCVLDAPVHCGNVIWGRRQFPLCASLLSVSASLFWTLVLGQVLWKKQLCLAKHEALQSELNNRPFENPIWAHMSWSAQSRT